MNNYKPEGYISLAPYLIVENAPALVEFVKKVFGGIVLQQNSKKAGYIKHVEVKLDDSLIMVSEATESYPAVKAMLHMYVPDLFVTYEKALSNGGQGVIVPRPNDEYTNIRGAFLDCCGNYWAISQQINE